MLQIQYQRGGPWNDHTSGLSQDDARALRDERRAAYPKCRYRLVRVTTTFAVEPEARRPS
jgi:hypothetical protein